MVQVEPVSVTREIAARMVGVSLSTFERTIQPDLRIVRIGRVRLIPISELRAWVERNSERVL